LKTKLFMNVSVLALLLTGFTSCKTTSNGQAREKSAAAPSTSPANAATGGDVSCSEIQAIRAFDAKAMSLVCKCNEAYIKFDEVPKKATFSAFFEDPQSPGQFIRFPKPLILDNTGKSMLQLYGGDLANLPELKQLAINAGIDMDKAHFALDQIELAGNTQLYADYKAEATGAKAGDNSEMCNCNGTRNSFTNESTPGMVRCGSIVGIACDSQIPVSVSVYGEFKRANPAADQERFDLVWNAPGIGVRTLISYSDDMDMDLSKYPTLKSVLVAGAAAKGRKFEDIDWVGLKPFQMKMGTQLYKDDACHTPGPKAGDSTIDFASGVYE